MLIRLEKYSLYFLQQLGKAILCCLLPWGSLRKQYENDFFFFTTSVFDACRQMLKKRQLKPLFFTAFTKLPFYTSVSTFFFFFTV